MTELTPLAEFNKGKLAERFKENLTLVIKYPWIFSSMIEKLVITAAVAWSFYSLLQFLGGFL